MKILTIIPAYNEEETIGTVINRVKINMPESDIVTINDGSTDGTGKESLKAGAMVINLPFNLGIGGAMQTGYLYALRNAYDIAIQVDGDGQHDPAYIKQLVAPIVNNQADMVIGSRYVRSTSYKSTVLRRIGMLFFSSLVNFLTGQEVKDTTSGFRVVNRRLIEYFSARYPLDYPEVDVLVRLYKKKYKVLEIPVEMRERCGGKSSITILRSLYYMIKVSLSLIIGAVSPADS